jgi:DNA polymerase (family 10)
MVSNNDKPLGTNKIISDMFSQMADALASQRDLPFKILAYRKAAKVLADYPIDVEEAYKKGGLKALTAIPGIGAALSKKIAEFIETGHMKKYDEVMSQKPKGE